ncbi:hypothetical protein BKA62DRAFT_771810 [Auriculariales sp. MPI-PUGE-AT-0066]|nr:hypothetical protein BKA62DRAFT_771810 [Auriculariales sp. MPI-PUGE-AT-0066]
MRSRTPVIGLTLVIYDGLNLLPNEIRYIWLARNSITKWVYLINRYVSLVGMALLVRATGMLDWGDLNDTFCVATMGACLSLGALSIGVGNYLVLLKVWFLWDQRRAIIAITTLAWIVSYTTTLALVGVSIAHLVPSTFSFAAYGINVCGVIAKPAVLRGIWAAPIALEVLVFAFTVLNAAHRPRPANVSLGKALYRDGLLFFLALFALRVFNLIVIVSFRSSLQFIGSCLIWGVNATLLHRLILNQTRQPMAKITVEDDNESADGEDDGEYELDKADARAPTPERFSFFDMDAFARAQPDRRGRRGRKVTFAPSVTFFESVQQQSSLRQMFSDAFGSMRRGLKRAAGDLV